VDDRNYQFFLQRMNKFSDVGLRIVAYCLMPNHFHFLVRQDEPRTLSSFLGLLCKSYVMAFNKCFGRSGHLFEGKYKLKHVDHEEYLQYLSRYIHLNPVRAHLVKKAEDWLYSSCREYYGLRKKGIVCTELVLSDFGSIEEYKKFMETNDLKEDDTFSRYLIQ